MAIDIKSFGPSDKKVLKDNRGLSPYELLQKGLTQKAFERLSEDSEIDFGEEKTEKKEEAKPAVEAKEPTKEAVKQPTNVVKPTVEKVEPKPKPILSKPTQFKGGKVDNYSVMIRNKQSGSVKKVSKAAAERLLKYPNQYSLA